MLILDILKPQNVEKQTSSSQIIFIFASQTQFMDNCFCYNTQLSIYFENLIQY